MHCLGLWLFGLSPTSRNLFIALSHCIATEKRRNVAKKSFLFLNFNDDWINKVVCECVSANQRDRERERVVKQDFFI